MFGSVFNGTMVAVMKKAGGARANPAEIMEMESFSQRWAACVRKKDDELSAEKALEDVTMSSTAEQEEDEVTKLNRGSIVPQPGKYAKGSQEHLAATAAQSLSIYVSFVHEPETQSGLAKAIASSPLGRDSVQGQPGRLSLLYSTFIFCFLFCLFLGVSCISCFPFLTQEKLCADSL